MRNLLRLTSLVFTLAFVAHASTPINPTTTLTAETGNNTSAANTFMAQSNGNAGAGNVSKLPLRSLLYAGANTRTYVHYMPWFKTSSHMDIGLDEAQPATVNAQVADMMSRGIDGAIVDWYGPSSTQHNTVTINVMNAAQATGGKFTFAITEDSGALKKCAGTIGCSVTQQLVNDLTYVYQTFEPSPAYVRINGRPVIFFFGTEAYSIDWNYVRASTPGNPLFIFRNSGAFTKTQTDGGFSWVGISSDPTSMGLSYLDNFYATALKYPLEWTYGSGYKGFNDTLASWGNNRIVDQQCGQTWLKSWAEAGKYYSATNQLNALQVVTWNDYEEGTEIETGIDNCVSVSGSVSGNSLSWAVTGQENTIDHYTVFISLDGENLMPVDDVPAGVHSLDLSNYGFGPDNYTLYVKAVGKPSLTNKMSDAITWSIANQSPVAILSVTPSSGIAPVSVYADTSSSSDPDGRIVSNSIDFGDGTSVSGPSASHNYPSPGNYTVTATVTDNLGAVATTTTVVAVTANQPPVARLTVSPATGVAPLSVTADASASTDPDGSVASTTIDFGDGAVVNGSRASHSYTTAGIYTVSAKVTDDRGATSTATATVTVSAGNIPPVVSLTLSATLGIAPASVTAKAVASDSDGSIAATTINWGDGSALSIGATATHTYTKAGTYTVTATATDDKGAKSSTSATVFLRWGVLFTSPTNNSTSPSPVHVTARASSNFPITCMKIYVDGKVAYSINNTSQIDRWVKMAAGTRRVTVQAWDKAGTVYKTTVNVTVK